jgi:alkylation response protein AidB-like acyl-CoA dehydrogenase
MASTEIQGSTDSATQATVPTAADIIMRARGLRGLIESEASKTEEQGTLSMSVVDAMREAKLFWTLCPTELGGAGESILTHMTVLEEVSSSDASSGWTLMANATATTVAATQCTDEHIERMFGGPRMPVMALAFAPSGQCVEEKEGYRGGGRFGFGSGIAHADWVSGGLVVKENGSPKMLENGMPQVLGAFVPRSEIRLDGNWDVTGLQGTGSYDFEIIEQAIPREATFDQYFEQYHRGGAIAALGTYSYAAAGHAAVVVGIARRSLEEVARTASERKRLRSSETIATGSLFRSDFMKHEALFQAARALLHQVYGAAEATARAGQPVSNLELARIRQAVTWAHSAAREVVMFAFAAGASASLRNPSVIGRCLRDVTVAAQHIIVDPSTLVDAAPVTIDHWVASATSRKNNA